MSHPGKYSFFSQVKILFLTVATATFVIAIYHCIVVWRNHRRSTHHRDPESATVVGDVVMEASFVQLIPAHKYEKSNKFHEGECPVCLNEFQVGEELRTLPECMHSFHVPCIDMWLYSHRNCPMCRANATPEAILPTSDFGLDGQRSGVDVSMSHELGEQHISA